MVQVALIDDHNLDAKSLAKCFFCMLTFLRSILPPSQISGIALEKAEDDQRWQSRTRRPIRPKLTLEYGTRYMDYSFSTGHVACLKVGDVRLKAASLVYCRHQLPYLMLCNEHERPTSSHTTISFGT